MKPYGLPRKKDIEFPDKADIKYYALQSSSGNIPGKSGDIRSSFKNSTSKKASRRYFKKRERANVKKFIKNEISS